MNSPAIEQHLPNVEAPHVLVTGRVRPWKRGGPLTPGAVAKFRPAERDRWIPGAEFQVDAGKAGILTVIVLRVKPEETRPARTTWRRGDHRSVRTIPARVIPELVVVRVLEVRR